jgi:putative membrane protein
MVKSKSNPKFWSIIITILSGLVLCAVAFLMWGPRPAGSMDSHDVSSLPAINAILNSITTLLLITAFVFIKKKKITKHRLTMLTAFATSALFLISYTIYHWYAAGPKTYEGPFTALYFFILFTHIVLAATIVPLALVTLYRGWNMKVEKHRKIARITLPTWIYVSITGVIIYVMLYGI